MKKSSPAWTISGRKSEASKERSPGPGAYSPTASHLDASPKYAIGKSSRVLTLDMTNPGPGSYDPQNPGKKSPRAM